MKKTLSLVLLALVTFTLSACSSNDTPPDDAATMEAYEEYLNDNNPLVTMDVKDYGTIEFQLFEEVAPNSVRNFIYLTQLGYYDGLSFHRVIEGFMIQGGSSTNPTCAISGEFTKNGFDNPLEHTRGVLSMARTSNPDSATSQFFIMHDNSPHLDKYYAGFGGVTRGFDVLDLIATSKTGTNDAPVNDIIIESMTVDTKGVEYELPECYKTVSNNDFKDGDNLENLAYSRFFSEDNPVVTIEVENFGVMTLQLFPLVAPNTVKNMIMLIESNHYENTDFHRIIEDFMIQGGSGSNASCVIPGEFTSNRYQNFLRHTRGVLSMARTSNPNSATDQFFVMHKTSTHLDNDYASFGGLMTGFDVLDQIAQATTIANDRPENPIIIKSIQVDTKGVSYNAPICINN